jgi:vibriolysin
MVQAYSAYSAVTLKGSYSGDTGGGTTGTPVSTTVSGSVKKNQTVNHGPYTVLAGSTFSVTMTGTGNPDLYVRFGSQATTASYNCRSINSGATETCSVAVPAGQSSAYIMVRGTSAGSYNMTINYTRP